jgi:hypothetical protein
MSPIRQGNNRVGYGGRKLPSFICRGWFWFTVYYGGWLALIAVVLLILPREWHTYVPGWTMIPWFFINCGVFLFTRQLGEQTAETCRKNYRR